MSPERKQKERGEVMKVQEDAKARGGYKYSALPQYYDFQQNKRGLGQDGFVLADSGIDKKNMNLVQEPKDSIRRCWVHRPRRMKFIPN
ncbi:hypothetical protein YC2023_021695 [Brassica napus]